MLILDVGQPALSLAFTPDSTRLVVAPRDGRRLDVWTLATGECAELCEARLSTDDAPVVHPSGKAVYVAGQSPFTVASLCDQPHRVFTAVGHVRTVIASPDGEWVVAGLTDDGRRLLGFRCSADGSLPSSWTWEDNSQTWEHPGGFVGAGERFVTVGNQVLVVRETATGAALFTVPHPSYSVGHRAASPDGTRFALMVADRLYVWDTAAWGKPMPIEGNSTWPFASFAFHPTRPVLAVVQRGQTLVKLFDWNTGKPVAKFQWELGAMECVAFSPDGTLAAAGSAGGRVVVWDVDA